MTENLKSVLEKIITGHYGKYFKIFEKQFYFPGGNSLRRAYKLFSATERVVFLVLTCLMAVTALAMLFNVNNNFSVVTPEKGGSLNEGIVGNPRFINPVLAVTDADKDLSALVYAGLLKARPDGTYENVLAKSVDISPDGKTYFVHIRDDAKFHNGERVTADDVIFTIEKIKDSSIKSPKRANWEGVTLEKIDSVSVNFVLKQPYAPFLENLTLGIIPKSVWSKVTNDEFAWSDINLHAIGAGPYKVTSVTRDSGGIPSSVSLKAFEDFVTGEPYITKIEISFYNNENKAVSALLSGEIDSLGGISPENAKTLEKRGVNMKTATLPRVFGLFLNQNQNKILADKNIRRALSLAAPRDEIVSDSLGGFGISVDGPLADEMKASDTYESRFEQAENILEKMGYKMSTSTGLRTRSTSKGKTQTISTIKFSISTADTPDLVSAANIVKNSYKRLGMDVAVSIFETGDLQQNIIRERKYEVLLFGEVVGREKDLYPFWHSSERFDPGLNIALYANSKVDKLLDTLRKVADNDKQQETLSLLIKEFDNDTPAVFLYAPKYVYAVSKRVGKVELGTVNHGSERFLNVSDWYVETKSVWKIFVR